MLRPYRAEIALEGWEATLNASTAIYNSLSSDFQPAFFQLVHHPVLASSTLATMWIASGINQLRVSQARLSANQYADKVLQLFEQDYDIELEYHTILNGKWDQ